MSFSKIIKRLILPGERFFLQTESTGLIRDEFTGDFNTNWTDTKRIYGAIQGEAKFSEYRGEEEIPKYIGLFQADFNLPIESIGDYRIKRIVDDNIYYYKILDINREIKLKNRKHHYELILGKDPKWQVE